MSERISEGEQHLLEILWEGAPLGAADVASRVDPARSWTLQTVKTMLSRLLAKGALAHQQDGRRFLYRPAIDRDAFVARESERLIDRMYGGRVTPLVAQLAESNRLTPTDIAEIEALLKELKQ